MRGVIRAEWKHTTATRATDRIRLALRIVEWTVRRRFCSYFPTYYHTLGFACAHVQNSRLNRKPEWRDRDGGQLHGRPGEERKIQIRPRRAIRHRSVFAWKKEKTRDRYVNTLLLLLLLYHGRYTMCDGYTRVFSVNFYLIVVFFFFARFQTVKTLRAVSLKQKKKNEHYFSVFFLSILWYFVRVLKSLTQCKTTDTRLSVWCSQTFWYFPGKP